MKYQLQVKISSKWIESMRPRLFTLRDTRQVAKRYTLEGRYPYRVIELPLRAVVVYRPRFVPKP